MNALGETNLLALLAPWLEDPEVVAVMADGHDRFYVERGLGEACFEDAPSPFASDEHLVGVVTAAASALGYRLDAANPTVDARLPGGLRFHAVLPPVSLVGPVLVVRKFRPASLTLGDAVRFGSLSADMAAMLRACVRARLNIAIAGGAASGKTTVLNLLTEMIPAHERVITVENAGELGPPAHLKYLVRLESRLPDSEGRGEVTARDLVVNALRMRPDRLVVGEVRAAEALELLQAMTTGHDGTLFSMHAESTHDALARLEMHASFASLALPVLTVRRMIASGIDVITYQERLRDGRRKMLKIAEVVGMEGDAIALRDIFEFRQSSVDQDGVIGGVFAATGYVPTFVDRLRATDVELPADLL